MWISRFLKRVTVTSSACVLIFKTHSFCFLHCSESHYRCFESTLRYAYLESPIWHNTWLFSPDQALLTSNCFSKWKRTEIYYVFTVISPNIVSFTIEVSFIFGTSINMTLTKYFRHTLAWQCQHVKESLLLLVYSWYKKNRVKEVEGTLLCGEHT